MSVTAAGVEKASGFDFCVQSYCAAVMRRCAVLEILTYLSTFRFLRAVRLA